MSRHSVLDAQRSAAAADDAAAAYLDRLGRHLAGRVDGEEVLAEIAEHLADARAELLAAGVDPATATASAVAGLGHPRRVARRLPRRIDHPHHWVNVARRCAQVLAAVSVAGFLTAAGRVLVGDGQVANVIPVYATAGFVAIMIIEQLRGREPAMTGDRHSAPTLAVLAVCALVAAGLLATSPASALSIDLLAAAAVWAVLAERYRRRRAPGAPTGAHS